MTAQLPALKSLAILLSPPVVSTQLGMILSPAITLFLQKLVDMVGLGRHVDNSLSQSLPALGTCQVLGMISGINAFARHLSGAGLWGAHSACQVLVGYGARSTCHVLSSQCLSGAGWLWSSQRLSGAGWLWSSQHLPCAGWCRSSQCLSGAGWL